MKKFLLATLAASAVTTSAHATGALNLDLRAEFGSQTFNSAAVTGGAGADNTRFYIQTGRLDYQNKLNEETNYRLRWRFAGKDQATLQKRDNAFQDLDYAFVTHKFTDFMALTVGKLGSEIGGFEGNNSGAEMYFTSEAYNGTSYLGGYKNDAAAPAGKLTGFVSQVYVTGAKLVFSFLDQEIGVQATNSDTAIGRDVAAANTGDHTNAASKFDQNQSMYGLVYKGKFAGNWQVRASYHTAKPQNPDSGSQADFYALGGQFQNDAWLIQLDALMDSYKKTGSATGTDTVNSYVLSGKWTFINEVSAILKVAYSEDKLDDATTAKNKYTSEGLAFEYKPKKDDTFRYHIAYNYRNMEPDAGSSRNLQEVFVGTRILTDFMK